MLKVLQRQGKNINVQCQRTDLSHAVLIGIIVPKHPTLQADIRVKTNRIKN